MPETQEQTRAAYEAMQAQTRADELFLVVDARLRDCEIYNGDVKLSEAARDKVYELLEHLVDGNKPIPSYLGGEHGDRGRLINLFRSVWRMAQKLVAAQTDAEPLVDPSCACPHCDESRQDQLEWIAAGARVRCHSCGGTFEPSSYGGAEPAGGEPR